MSQSISPRVSDRALDLEHGARVTWQAPADWDSFVDRHPHGQYQQATPWFVTKAREGWSAVWVSLRGSEGSALRAGAQILIKKTRFGPVGFLNKGPLVQSGEDAAEAICRAVGQAQDRLGLRAIIAQAADRDTVVSPALERAGFGRDTLLPIISATQVIDVSRPWEAIEKDFRRSTRKKIRQGKDRGVVITEGGAADVAQFFELMKSTCVRQETSPNPASVEATQALWQAFETPRRIRIHFAEHEGRRIAAGLCLLFGDRVTFWKKGWDQSNPLLQSNTILTCNAIQWAAEHGYKWLDFSAVSRDVAEAMIAKAELPADVEERRDFFNLGFGGEGWVLPPVLVRFRTRLERWAFRCAQRPPWRSFAGRALQGLGA